MAKPKAKTRLCPLYEYKDENNPVIITNCSGCKHFLPFAETPWAERCSRYKDLLKWVRRREKRA